MRTLVASSRGLLELLRQKRDGAKGTETQGACGATRVKRIWLQSPSGVKDADGKGNRRRSLVFLSPSIVYDAAPGVAIFVDLVWYRTCLSAPKDRRVPILHRHILRIFPSKHDSTALKR